MQPAVVDEDRPLTCEEKTAVQALLEGLSLEETASAFGGDERALRGLAIRCVRGEKAEDRRDVFTSTLAWRKTHGVDSVRHPQSTLAGQTA